MGGSLSLGVARCVRRPVVVGSHCSAESGRIQVKNTWFSVDARRTSVHSSGWPCDQPFAGGVGVDNHVGRPHAPASTLRSRPFNTTVKLG